MKMISNRDACNWCGRVIELVEGKKYCDECCRCCKRECRTCHKPYSSLKYFPNSDAEHCNSCTKHNKKRKTKYTKNEAIACCDIGQKTLFSRIEFNSSNVLSSRVTNYKNDIHKFS